MTPKELLRKHGQGLPVEDLKDKPASKKPRTRKTPVAARKTKPAEATPSPAAAEAPAAASTETAPEVKSEAPTPAIAEPVAKEPEAVATPTTTVPAPVSTPATTPTPEPQPAKRLTALEQIKLARERMRSGNVVESIEEAREVRNDPSSIEVFLDAVDAADRYAAGKSDSCLNWRELSLTEMEEQLAIWAKIDHDVVSIILDSFAAFRLKVSVLESFWRLVPEVLRPAREIRKFYDLSALMSRLEDIGLVVVRRPAELHGEKAKLAVIVQRHEKLAFLPANALAEGAWKWVKEAEVRAVADYEQRLARLAALKKEATGLRPVQARTGTEGKVFLSTGEGKGALVQVRKNAACVSVKILEVVGHPLGLEKTGWTNWDAEKRFWPYGSEDIFRAFQVWKRI